MNKPRSQVPDIVLFTHLLASQKDQSSGIKCGGILQEARTVEPCQERPCQSDDCPYYGLV